MVKKFKDSEKSKCREFRFTKFNQSSINDLTNLNNVGTSPVESDASDDNTVKLFNE